MTGGLAAWLREVARALAGRPPPAPPPPPPRAAIHEQYVRTPPSVQNALHLFKGEWWSRMPGEFFPLEAGRLPLFLDDRIDWAIESFGGVQGKDVLELGPLEGGHTFMLEKAGAKSVLAIEANTRAFIKCLIVKELVQLQRARFLLGDFVEYLRAPDRKFDAVVACGVLYHMQHPVEVIHNLGRVADQVYIWTHYYDEEHVRKLAHASCFSGVNEATYQGFAHQQYVCEYRGSLDTMGFTGGAEAFAHWLTREDLLGALRHAGFIDIRIRKDHPEHDNGPCIELTARRESPPRAA